jgi:hypothetical protein
MNLIEIVDILLPVLIFSAIGYLLIALVLSKLQNRRLAVRAAQAEIDRLAVYIETQELLKNEAARVESSDGFVKFMSKSRDWAFEYIETVQEDLLNLKELFDDVGVAPKTVAQANDLSARIERVLSNLPKEDKNV